MPQPTIKVADFVDADFLDDGLKKLQSDFKGWQDVDGRGKHSLWAMLGQIYELGDKVSRNGLARSELIKKVDSDPDVRKSNRWQAERKSPNELLIVSLLGLKDQSKGTRSQWHSALKAARKAGVPTTGNDFSNWIREIGGVDAARRTLRKPKSQGDNFDTLAKRLDDFVDQEAQAFRLPESYIDAELPAGYGLVLVKQIDKTSEAIPIVTIANERQIVTAMKGHLAATDRIERENIRNLETELRATHVARRKKVRKLYNKARKAGRLEGDFDEFLSEWEDENLLPEEAHSRITETYPSDNSGHERATQGKKV